MTVLAKWLATILGPVVAKFLASRIMAAIRLGLRKARNRMLRKRLETAQTLEERESATKDIVDQFYRDTDK